MWGDVPGLKKAGQAGIYYFVLNILTKNDNQHYNLWG